MTLGTNGQEAFLPAVEPVRPAACSDISFQICPRLFQRLMCAGVTGMPSSSSRPVQEPASAPLTSSR